MAKAEYRSAIRSRKLILTALADLLEEKPLEKITVTDVVNRAGINRGTFYAHFADIPDVINHLIQHSFDAIRDAIASENRPLAEVAHSVLKQVQFLLEEDLAFCRKILNSSAYPLMQDQLVSFVVDYLLQNRDSYYTGDPARYELAIRFGAGGLSNLYRDWFAGKLPYSLDELTQIGEELLLQVARGIQ